MTNEELKQKCLEYDKHFGTHRESEYEGFGVYDFITTGDKNYFAADDGSLERWEKDLENFIPDIDMVIKGYQLRMVCPPRPDEYDVFKDGKQVGYLKYRLGKFKAETPISGGKLVLETIVLNGDFPKNIGNPHLKEAIKAIDKSLNPD